MADKNSGFPPWMKALGGLILAAALANGAMVWLSLRGERDLVRSDYYQAGLEQDARMARRARADGHRLVLAEVPEGWTVEAEALASKTPGGTVAGDIDPLAGSRCRIRFTRPDDGREDKVTELPWAGAGPGGRLGKGIWLGPGPSLKAGHWDVLVEWERDGKVFMESPFNRYIHE